MFEEQARSELEFLVERCAAGDRQAWEEFVLQVWQGLVRILAPWLHRRFPGEDSWCLAEDIVQDFFMELWHRPGWFGRFNPSRGTIGALLTKAVRRRAAKLLRRRRQPPTVPLSPDLNVADERLIPEEVYAKVAEFLTRLPPQAKAVLQHFHLSVPTEADREATTPQTFWQTTFDLTRWWKAFWWGG